MKYMKKNINAVEIKWVSLYSYTILILIIKLISHYLPIFNSQTTLFQNKYRPAIDFGCLTDKQIHV